jgi:hypothetical protein
MGWLADAAENGVCGFWGMNDAGRDLVSQSQPPRVAWFQVSLTEPIPADQPLPVQPFLACAGDVVARMGKLRLEAVQVLLPVQCLPAPSGIDAVWTLLRSIGWFADGNPHLSTPVRATLDGGQSPSIRSAAPRIFQWMREVKQDVFACDSFSLMDDPVLLKPAVIDELWLGPAHHRVTFHGTLAEWSLDAVGWLAAFLASASSQHGVSTPLMLTVSRAERPVSRVE